MFHHWKLLFIAIDEPPFFLKISHFLHFNFFSIWHVPPLKSGLPLGLLTIKFQSRDRVMNLKKCLLLSSKENFRDNFLFKKNPILISLFDLTRLTPHLLYTLLTFKWHTCWDGFISFIAAIFRWKSDSDVFSGAVWNVPSESFFVLHDVFIYRSVLM